MNLGRETETLEFKKSTGELKEGVVSMVAMLNKHQKGELYFGVKSDGTPVGQEITEKTLRDISQAISNHIEPQVFPEISAVSMDGCECVHVCFEGYNTPYFAYGVARIRVADEDKMLSQRELVNFVKRQSNKEDQWEKQLSPISLDEVKEESVKQYVQRAKAVDRINFDYTDKATVLNKLSLTNGSRLLNAGMVLFGESIYGEVQLAVFAGTERLTFLDMQRHRASVFDLVKMAELYVTHHTDWRVEFDGSLQRKEIPEIPKEAIREALINSFCHKDYGACQTNEVAVYKDRVEIYNPGRFPEGYQPEDFICGQERSIRRNPLIASVLYYTKDVETFGTGLRRISDACKAAGCRVRFQVLKSGFVVVLYRGGEKTDSAGGTETLQATAQVTGQGRTEAVLEKILAYCFTPRSRQEMQDFCGLTGRNSFRNTYLKPLLESGQLRMTIPDKPNSRNQKYIASEALEK